MVVISVNNRAAKIVGLRRERMPGVERGLAGGVVIINEPCELGYHCPVCKYEIELPEGDFDDRLEWSEYEGFLWCRTCNKDYPSALCQPDIDKAIDVYLSAVDDAITRKLKVVESRLEELIEMEETK